MVTGGDPARMEEIVITKGSMRTAFASYTYIHEAASIRRCWSTWNALCTFHYIDEQLAANPKQLVDRPKLAKALPRALPRTGVETVTQDHGSKRETDLAERDLAIILAELLAGLRSDELRQVNIGDIRFPEAKKRRATVCSGLARWSARSHSSSAAMVNPSRRKHCSRVSSGIQARRPRRAACARRPGA
jgi:site-specific recombinase XerC